MKKLTAVLLALTVRLYLRYHTLELDEIMNLADTIGVLYRGEMLKTEAADRMTTREVGRYMMGVKEA